jgi:hypothetical protein
MDLLLPLQMKRKTAKNAARTRGCQSAPCRRCGRRCLLAPCCCCCCCAVACCAAACSCCCCWAAAAAATSHAAIASYAVNVIAAAGAALIMLGTEPFHSPATPSLA